MISYFAVPRRQDSTMLAEFAAFLLVSALVIVTPGQDTALTIRNSLLGGRSGGIATAAGVATGQATWAVATSLGVAALLRASEPAFLALRLAGAVYLVYLGAQALVSAFHSRGRRAATGAATRRLAPSIAYRQGVLSNLGNPKMAVFFISLLPQFTKSFAGLLALGVVFCCLTLVWLSVYAIAVSRARNLLARAPIRRAFDATTGAVLVAFGIRLAAER
jgi:threonine/homoserine/homoserine lactone efflux protein